MKHAEGQKYNSFWTSEDFFYEFGIGITAVVGAGVSQENNVKKTQQYIHEIKLLGSVDIIWKDNPDCETAHYSNSYSDFTPLERPVI